MDNAPTMDETFGAMLIGVLFATFFQGILTVQTYIFFEAFPNDLLRVKLLVIVVWLLDATHLVLIAQACYHYLITSWGNDAALLQSTPPLDLHLIFVGAPSLLCQAFFIHRIWMLSKCNIPLVLILGAACLADFGLGLTISGQIVQFSSVTAFSRYTGEAVGLFSIGAIVDVAIALVLVFYLQQGKMHNHYEHTNWMLARVMQYTVATGLATSLLAVACLVIFLLLPHTFIFIAMHFSLGRLYTNALLATLNSRRSLRNSPHVHTTPMLPSFAIMTSRVVTTTVDGHDATDAGFALKDMPPSPTSARAASSEFNDDDGVIGRGF